MVVILSYGTWTELFVIKRLQKMWVCGVILMGAVFCFCFYLWLCSAPLHSSEPKKDIQEQGCLFPRTSMGQGCKHFKDVCSGNWDLV